MVHRTGGDLPPELRCEWIKASSKQCMQPKLDNDASRRWCKWHEDALTQRYQRFRIAEDIPDLSIEQHLGLELRMAYVMVRELEFQVLDLGLSTDAWVIDTEERETRESDDPKNSYISSKRAKLHGAHPVIVQYLREREHYSSVIKLCISAGLAARQVAIIERYVESLVDSQMALARSLGHDPNDPTVRAAIMETIRQQQAALEDLAPADPRRALEA